MKEETLQEWASHYHSNDEMRQTFRVQSDALQRTHKYGYYVTDFNLDKIILGETERQEKYVMFKEVAPLPENKEAELMKKNVKTECFLEVGLYSDMLNDLRIQFTPDFLKENFDKFSLFLPEEDFKYYKKVLVYDTMIYLCDYLDKTAQQEVTKLEEELGGGNSRSLTKATPQGRALAEKDKVAPFSKPDQQAAFAYTFVLPFVIFTLSLMIPLLAIILGSLT